MSKTGRTKGEKTLADFRKWAEEKHHYPVIEAIERYLKMLKEKK